jgi:hypothetical protein
MRCRRGTWGSNSRPLKPQDKDLSAKMSQKIRANIKTKRKGKRKKTAAEKRAARKRRKETMIVFINGKQKRVPRPQLIDGLEIDEFVRRNADPIWLHQNEMCHLMPDFEHT